MIVNFSFLKIFKFPADKHTHENYISTEKRLNSQTIWDSKWIILLDFSNAKSVLFKVKMIIKADFGWDAV